MKNIELKNINVNAFDQFCGNLTIAFIVLKLLGHISWSWWWVLSPLWIPLVIVFGLLGIILLVGLILGALSK